MGKLSYILGCVTRMDYPELFRTVGKVHKITGKNSVGILADVVKCGLKYGAGFNDYLLCEFYNLTDAQRATYITRSVNNTLVSLLNDREYYHFFDNKSEFYTTFGNQSTDAVQNLFLRSIAHRGDDGYDTTAGNVTSCPIPPAAALA